MTTAPAAPRDAAEVRDRLEEALRLDLVGPETGSDRTGELLPGETHPSNWYLTGFLVPAASDPDQRSDPQAEDDLDREAPGDAGLAEESADDGTPAKKSLFPSSLGLSFLVPPDAGELAVTARWGDYTRDVTEDPRGAEEGAERRVWRRHPQSAPVSIPLAGGGGDAAFEVPESGGLRLQVVRRPLPASGGAGALPAGTQAVSVFLVNERPVPADDRDYDTACAFQAQILVHCPAGFVGRLDARGAPPDDPDRRLAELHYRDTPNYATGHGVAADWDVVEGACREVRTAWIPRAEVERTETAAIPGVELSLDVLGSAADGAAAEAMLRPLAAAYRQWIAARGGNLANLDPERRTTAEDLLRRAGFAADRIERGVAVLASDPAALDAFRMANRAVALALRKRTGAEAPRWRAFQLAFLLLNLPGLADRSHPDRETADLLFFPTGGGKTEAYLALAAFAMVLRRLRQPDAAGAGVSVIMRYTLRLLTFDQLHRAAGLVCALELLRARAPERYGEWPFEIGLWVGKAATPNQMGKKGDRRQDTARARTIAFKEDPEKNPCPIPLRNCPWCGTEFGPASFSLQPNHDHPGDLRVVCVAPGCDFVRDRALPIVAVDEPLYRRLPAFLVATLDKFASLPWAGPSGALLGGAERGDRLGFYGAAEPRRGSRLPAPLPPPDLIIQDELHLISGPLGTLAGLYETAVDALCAREREGKRIRPKIVASTATANRAEDQIQALFGRARTEVFPPPGPDRRDSFFAESRPAETTPARRYLGIAAPGRSAKVMMRRVLLPLLAAAQRSHTDAGGTQNASNPADPYMTLLAYFNALRELGGARRILEEEVQGTLARYGDRRRRIGEPRQVFANRRSLAEVVELTSRVSADTVARTRARLNRAFHEPGRVDTAIATNMISVGLDVPRLGLMVVVGQPKTNAEYIQATSRIGRDTEKPGLVVTLLNIHKPRDRSHYERFRHYHETFYRAVEPASVTPFAARALDRGFAGGLVTLARYLEPQLTPSEGASRVAGFRSALETRIEDAFVSRVEDQPIEDEDELDERVESVRARIGELLDGWRQISGRAADGGATLHYQRLDPSRQQRQKPTQWLLREMIETGLDPLPMKFRTGRSLRDVEPEAPLVVRKEPAAS